MKVSRIMSGIVSQILIDLKSRKEIFCGVDLFKGMEDEMENYEVDNQEIEGKVEDSEMEEIDGDNIEEKPEWMTRSNTINPLLYPVLSRFGPTISDVDLSNLLSELVSFSKHVKKIIKFQYKNGKKGLLLEIPKTISHKYINF